MKISLKLTISTVIADFLHYDQGAKEKEEEKNESKVKTIL